MSNQYGDIQYDDTWIRENYSNKVSDSFVASYNAHTGQNIKKETLRAHIKRSLKISPEGYYYTDEQRDFVRQNYEKYGMKITTKMFNEHFGSNKSESCIRQIARQYGLHVPIEVLTKNSNPNIDAVGTIREEPSTGYLVIKTGNSYKDWMKYQRYVYEQAYGKIPKDHVIVFLDGNNRNFELSNLMAVPKNYVVYMNTFDMRTDCPELTKVAIRWCELYEVLKKRGVI